MISREDHFVLPRISRKTVSFCMLLFLILASLPVMGDELPNDGRPQVFLNHVIVHLDSITYAAVGNSDFLTSAFGSCDVKTVTADSGQSSWSGTYVTGQNTYIEFFNVGQRDNIGFSAIGFGVETQGGIARLSEHCTRSGITNFISFVRRREINGVDLPWFEGLGIVTEDTTVRFTTGTWVMEYRREYMAAKFPNLTPDSIEVTRRLYNSESYRNDLLLQDIIEIELAVNEPDYSKLLNDLGLYGYKIEQDEETARAIGLEMNVILRPKSESLAGICRIRFALTDKPYEQHTEVFSDRSKLVLNPDSTADWFFFIK